MQGFLIASVVVVLGIGGASAVSAQEPDLAAVSKSAPAAVAPMSDEQIADVISKARPIQPPTGYGASGNRAKPGPQRQIAEPEAPKTLDGLPVSAAHGRLYIVNPDGSSYGWCSASVVASGSRDLIETAAHCVHGGPGSTWLFERAFFVPGLDGGHQPHGVFWARHWIVWNAWINNRDFDKDYSFVNLHPQDGRSVMDAVGGNGLTVNASYSQTAVIWGYPAESPYPGDVPYSCDRIRTYKDLFQSDIKANCGMVPGASGGPWLINYDYGTGRGFLNGITSRVNAERTTIRSSYFNDNVAKLYYEVD